jgi:GDPmannose 4,6-dehydratase
MKAFITGISGMDGSYLAEYLLGLGYEVVGLVRRSSTNNLQNLSGVIGKINLVYGDLTDQGGINNIIKTWMPDEVYNLGAMSFVPVSWKSPEYTMNVNALGPLRILEAIRQYKPDTRFLQASTSEQFGKALLIPQSENTPFYPRSPYGVSKVAAYWTTINYRESYNLFAATSICFNHDSVRRGEEFVTRKISNAVARIKLGMQEKVKLGNLKPRRDIGHSKDYVRAMHLILQHPEPETFVIGTGESHSIEEICKVAFDRVGLNYLNHIEQDLELFRPAEVDTLLADATKAREVLGWKPQYKFEDIINEMVDYDLRTLNG